jgi:hypothetical protein
MKLLSKRTIHLPRAAIVMMVVAIKVAGDLERERKPSAMIFNNHIPEITSRQDLGNFHQGQEVGLDLLWRAAPAAVATINNKRASKIRHQRGVASPTFVRNLPIS